MSSTGTMVSAGGRTQTALVVEDSADVAVLLEATLSGQGFRTETASAGHAALEAARRMAPDLITLDLGLPDIDGFEVCRSLRTFTNAYILIVSARGNESDRVDGLDVGADDYLTKPVNPLELVARVTAMMRRPRAPRPPESELATAARVQRSLLPDRSPSVPGYDVAGACRPSRSVGGDFFDWVPDGGVLTVTLADAMGKGMGAALVAATARAVLRSARHQQDAEALVRQAAAALETDLERLSSFITVLHLRLDAATGGVDYVDAGHGMGLLVHPDGRWERMLSGGPPLGLVPGTMWQPGSLHLEPGGAVAVVSDGVLDAFDTVEETLDAVAAVVRGTHGAAGAVDAILGLAEDAEDDVTAVVLHRSPRRATGAREGRSG
ncbi:PP2C family protein-serine/threonine phosphatase [Kocuria sp. M1R5S2]|uniref:PP2C family protein-serine/threonine phosphatase n=1 Tax=Kocuria rhizosphaerae TaxID=3376285 RepID=UPI0037BCA946